MALRKNIFIIFWIIALTEIISVSIDNTIIHLIVKPLLVPVLILAVLISVKKATGKKLIIAALFFSFLGDVFLMYQEKDPMLFTLGLASFLITHVFYIFYFMKLIKAGTSGMKGGLWVLILVIAYAALLLYLLMPGLGDFKVPVIVYACIISTMLFFSLNLPMSVKKKAGIFFTIGAFSFVVSDSLLAINKFLKAFPFAAATVMLTYCLAQYLIVKGFIRNSN